MSEGSERTAMAASIPSHGNNILNDETIVFSLEIGPALAIERGPARKVRLCTDERESVLGLHSR